MNEPSKICNVCYKSQSAELFYRNQKYFKSCNDCSRMAKQKYSDGTISGKSKDELKAYNALYYAKNRDRLLDKITEQKSICSNVKWTCECGSIINQTGKKKHLTTDKHKRLMSTYTPESQ